MKNTGKRRHKNMGSGLCFDQVTPLASRGLGGLVRDHFGNGRLFATVSAHGGLTDISYWGRQPAGAVNLFHGAAETPWVKLFRAYAGVGQDRYYLTLSDTRLFPFGYASHAVLGGISFEHQMMLLPDALVHRFQVTANPRKRPVRIEALHQEGCTAITSPNRKWSDFTFDPECNALIAACTELNPRTYRGDNGGLAQRGSPLVVKEVSNPTLWIGIGCDSPLRHHRGYHRRSKHYLTGSEVKGKTAALFMVFAHSRRALAQRLAGLAKTVHQECDKLVAGYEARVESRPHLAMGNKVLESAFGQFPECNRAMAVPDRPGAIRATLSGYFVWGWDGMNSPVAGVLADGVADAADTLRFYHQARHKEAGIPHCFTSTFQPSHQSPFPAQAQFIAVLYHVIAVTDRKELARELMPTCRFIIDRCRKRVVGKTGLVRGNALWPDFPEAMEENGHDISSLNNSLLYQGLRAMEFLALAADDGALASECREWAVTLRASFIKYLYDEEKGFFISSCDSRDFKPRKHYCAQAVFWITPFARELVAHAPRRIADFMDRELRADKCLLTLPHWDTAWMADGNQLGSTFPTADVFYLNVQKLLARSSGLDRWLGDVEWFWRRHTAPEAFTPEAINEAEIGVDNAGCKQLQATSNWYFGFFTGLAGLEIDHEGLTLTPWGARPVSLKGLRLHGIAVDLEIKGKGDQAGSLKLNGQALTTGCRKILWSQLKGRTARIELVRSSTRSSCPVIVRADGLRVRDVHCGRNTLHARVAGDIAGEVVVQATRAARILVNGRTPTARYDAATGSFCVSVVPGNGIELEVTQ